MSCFQSQEEQLQHRINREIDRQLQREKRELKSEIKLLLLGIGRREAVWHLFFVAFLNLI